MELWPVPFLVWILLIPLEFASPVVLSGVGIFTAQSPFIMMLLKIAGPLPSNLSLDNTLEGHSCPYWSSEGTGGSSSLASPGCAADAVLSVRSL